MPATFPGGVPALTNPLAGDPTTLPDHAAQHADANDEIEALADYLLNTAGWIDAAKLAASSVTSSKIANSAVSDAKTGAPTSGSLGTGVRYARMGEMISVWVEGSATGAHGTLPSGFRPAATIVAPAVSSDPADTPAVQITTAGVITSTGTTPVWFNLTFKRA